MTRVYMWIVCLYLLIFINKINKKFNYNILYFMWIVMLYIKLSYCIIECNRCCHNQASQNRSTFLATVSTVTGTTCSHSLGNILR